MGNKSSDLIMDIRICLHPNLLKREWKLKWESCNPAFGHCYHASEALYFMLGGPLTGWKSVCCKVDGLTHWWLQHTSGWYLDPTVDQFILTGQQVPWLQSNTKIHSAGFMGQRKDPSNKWGFGRKPGVQANLILEQIDALRANIKTNS